jgi:glycosyltransferase involved in cell wall biosynthesis
MSPPDAPKVLMIAYACNPEGSGEHWLGWGWAEQAAKNYRVHLFTTTNAREQVERHAKAHGIQPYFVPLNDTFRAISNRFGRFGGWARKTVWAYKVARLARELHKKEKFAIAHKTTFHTFRIPFLSTQLGIPTVWGPLAGGENIPYGFYKFVGPLFLPESMRRLLNGAWLSLPSVQRSLAQTDVIFASNRTSLNYFGPIAAAKSIVVPPNAMRPEDEQTPARAHVRPKDKTFRLLYVGNCLATRAMPLAFAALARAKMNDCELTIIGHGSGFKFWQRQARKYRVTRQVKFLGQLPHAELAQYYENSDLLIFPALRDSGGSALLEAMSKGLPVICLDWGGPAEMVDDGSGVKVPMTTPAQTIQAFADALVRLQKDPELRARLGAEAARRARTHFTWASKRRLLEETYNRLLSGR